MGAWQRWLPGGILCLACLLPSQPALQAAPEPSIALSDVLIPQEVGYVLGRYQPAGASNPPLVILVQEAHANYEGQKHLAELLDHLARNYGLSLILAEGGEGNASLAYLRDYANFERRQQVAEEYLRTGVLSGEEYFELTTDHPVSIWGVERQDLYRANVESLVNTESIRTSAKGALADLRGTIESLKPSVFDSSLLQLEEDIRRFERKELNLADYVTRLAELSEAHGVALGEYPSLTQFLQSHDMEATIRPELAAQEQAALVGRLSQRVNAGVLQALKDRAAEVKQGRASREAFYAELRAAAESADLDLGEYPELARYTDYLRLRGSINLQAMVAELDALARDLTVALAASDESRRLLEISEQLALAEQLADLALTTDEYERFGAVYHEGLVAEWMAALDELRSGHGLPPGDATTADALQAALPALTRFYEIARARDEALVENTIVKLRSENSPLAVLITGGFHARAIAERLNDAGIACMSLALRTTDATNEPLYRAVLKYKSGHGTLDDVLAATGRWPAPEPASGH